MISCDIILTVYNNLELTKNCLQSLFRHFRPGDNLIIVNNGSGRQTSDYLEFFSKQNKAVSVQLINLYPNRGYIKAVNAGMQRTKGESVCLLSNDTVVTRGWLNTMCEIIELEPNVGIVNPLSNTFGVHWPKNKTLEEFAGSLSLDRGKYSETSGCVGFCMLIRREVIEKIGYLDETYGRGYFEDSDYSRRAQKYGFKCVIAKGAYVWHREHSTFASKEIEELFERNRVIFHKRWGKPLRILCVFSKMNSDSAVKSAAELSFGLARQGHRLWVVSASGDRGSNQSMETLISHANIKLFLLPKIVVIIYSLYIIIKKRKKKIDVVYLDRRISKRKADFVRLIFSKLVKEIKYA
ncbi:MAG: glycosyltransferase family 2 protein [Candidatus Omnitrophota bacterium]